MGLFAYLIAFLIGAIIAGVIYVILAFEWTLYIIAGLVFVIACLLIGIPIADFLGIHP
ncbi:TPA: hypothetical protein ACSVZR_003482 [Bacillus cereus]